MASDGISVKIPVASLVQGSQAPTTAIVPEVSGKVLPPSGKISTAPSAATGIAAGIAAATASTAASAATSAAEVAAPTVEQAPAPSATDAQSLVTQLNKSLNDSGRPDQYRVDPSSNNAMIQQINPANGAVVGEFLASEFPALARSVGVPGVLFNSRA